jgi:hypothetical protein
LLAGASTERRRLRQMATAGGGVATLHSAFGSVRLTERINPRLERIAQNDAEVSKEMSRLRRAWRSPAFTASAPRSLLGRRADAAVLFAARRCCG